MADKTPRPAVLGGLTIKAVTGCGPMYVHLNWYKGQLFEVFATLGKTGGCAMSQSEALTRSITLGLRCGVPVQEYIKQLLGIRCPSPIFFPKEHAVMSCPDAIARVLQHYTSLAVEDLTKLLVDGHEEVVQDEEALAKATLLALETEREREGLR